MSGKLMLTFSQSLGQLSSVHMGLSASCLDFFAAWHLGYEHNQRGKYKRMTFL
jgi:hypothetical protein